MIFSFNLRNNIVNLIINVLGMESMICTGTVR